MGVRYSEDDIFPESVSKGFSFSELTAGVELRVPQAELRAL